MRTVASSWKFSYECVCSVWWPDISWNRKCTSYRCGHGSVEVYTYPCLGSFTYHRGRLVVRNIGGVLRYLPLWSRFSEVYLPFVWFLEVYVASGFGSVPAVEAMVPTMVLEVISAVAAAWFLDVYVASGRLVLGSGPAVRCGHRSWMSNY